MLCIILGAEPDMQGAPSSKLTGLLELYQPNFQASSWQRREQLQQQLCTTYLHRMRIQSRYAVTISHTNLYERMRPARKSLLIPARRDLWHIKTIHRAWNNITGASEMWHLKATPMEQAKELVPSFKQHDRRASL